MRRPCWAQRRSYSSCGSASARSATRRTPGSYRSWAMLGPTPGMRHRSRRASRCSMAVAVLMSRIPLVLGEAQDVAVAVAEGELGRSVEGLTQVQHQIDPALELLVQAADVGDVDVEAE